MLHRATDATLNGYISDITECKHAQDYDFAKYVGKTVQHTHALKASIVEPRAEQLQIASGQFASDANLKAIDANLAKIKS